MKTLAFLLALVVLSCASKDFKEPGVKHTPTRPTASEFRGSFDQVWDAVQKALDLRRLVVAESRKEAGRVVTGWAEGPSDRLFSGYGESRIPYRIRYRLTVQVQPRRGNVMVSVMNEEQYFSDAVTAGGDFSGSIYQWIPTSSSTLKEASLLDEIERRLIDIVNEGR